MTDGTIKIELGIKRVSDEIIKRSYDEYVITRVPLTSIAIQQRTLLH